MLYHFTSNAVLVTLVLTQQIVKGCYREGS